MKRFSIKRIIYKLKACYFRVAELCSPSRINNATEIPIIINNFNIINTFLCTLNISSIFFNTYKVAADFLSHRTGCTCSKERIQNHVTDIRRCHNHTIQ